MTFIRLQLKYRKKNKVGSRLTVSRFFVVQKMIKLNSQHEHVITFDYPAALYIRVKSILGRNDN